MAGNGPAPKPRSQKHDRRPKSEFAELPAEGYAGEYPKLADKYKLRVWTGEGHVTQSVRFLADTRRWYESWATSPMATEFTLVHWLRLKSVAVLQDRFDRGDLTVAAELRQALAGFGGSPMDVRRLGRSIAPGSSPPAAKTSGGNKAAGDRRARLSVVK